jgi:hypothetical protein
MLIILFFLLFWLTMLFFGDIGVDWRAFLAVIGVDYAFLEAPPVQLL